MPSCRKEKAWNCIETELRYFQFCDFLLVVCFYLHHKIKTNQIAIVGSVEPRKGHDKAIVAFSKIVKKYPDLKLNIIGVNNDKEFSNTLIRLAEDLKLRDKIRFLGFSKDIKKGISNVNIELEENINIAKYKILNPLS